MRGLGLGRGFSLRKTTHTPGLAIVTSTWTGGGTTNNFSDAANWDVLPTANGILIFAGTTRLSPNNNAIAGTVFTQIVFASGAGAFTIGGNSIANTTDIINNSSNIQTVNTAISTTAAITVNAASQKIIVNGVISGAGGLTKSGSNIAEFTATNTFSGAVTFGAGTITINANNCLGSGTITTANGVTLQVTNGGTTQLNNPIVLVGTLNVIAIFGSGGDYRFNGVISGSGNINVPSDGNGRRLEFRAVNTFTGGITLGVGNQNTRGKLEAFNNNAFGTGPISWNQNGAYIGIYDGGVGPYTIPNAITIPSGAKATFSLINGGAAVDITGVISGSGALDVTDAGGGICIFSQDMTLGGAISVLGSNIQVAFNGNVTCGAFTSTAFYTQVTGTVASANFTSTVHMNVGIDSLANIGVLNVSGNAVFSSSNILTEYVSGGTAHSQINVGGTCALGGMTVEFSGDLNAGSHTIISSTGAMSGTAVQGTAPTGRTWVSLTVVSNNLIAVFT